MRCTRNAVLSSCDGVILALQVTMLVVLDSGYTGLLSLLPNEPLMLICWL